MTGRPVRRWEVGLVATLALTALGLLYANATLLSAALIPLSYVVYGAFSTLPADPSLAVVRRVEPSMPAPGERVEVTLTVENVGDSVLPDVRLVDGVPEELAVEEGTPRLCASLSPGETRTIRYVLVAKRGTYAFDRPVARLRSLAGTTRLTDELDATGDDDLLCVSTVRTTPGASRTTQHAGTVTADSAGAGLEFHSTRRYRPGDPLSRIDWHQVAKGGEATTVQYREERTSRTVLVLDARPVNRVTPTPGHPTAVDRCGYAGERFYEILVGAGVETTVVAVGVDRERGPVWADPSRGAPTPREAFEAVADAGSRGARQLRASPSMGTTWAASSAVRGARAGEATPAETETGPSPARADGGEETTRLLARLPSNARVILCSPLLDAWPLGLAETLAGREYDPLVMSPDPTGPESTGQRLAAVHRDRRLRELERLGVTAVDWPAEQPFEQTLRETLPNVQLYR